MTDVEYSPPVCQSILNEIILLLTKYEEHLEVFNKLDDLLSKHLSGNTKLNDFLSICCYGQKGVVIPLHVFNALCILPRTDWRFRLVSKKHSSSDPSNKVSPSSLDQPGRLFLIGARWGLCFLDQTPKRNRKSILYMNGND
jgi:hypothetical protein